MSSHSILGFNLSSQACAYASSIVSNFTVHLCFLFHHITAIYYQRVQELIQAVLMKQYIMIQFWSCQHFYRNARSFLLTQVAFHLSSPKLISHSSFTSRLVFIFRCSFHASSPHI